jgi:hypothetical protein
MIDIRYVEVLRKIYEKLAKSDVSWAITGSLNFALHGLQVEIHDIDIQTDKKGAYEIEQLLSTFMTKRVAYRTSKYIRSYFGVLVLDDITVEIMGGIQKKLKDGTWEETVNVNNYKEIVKLESMEIPVLSLEYEQKAYRQLGRIEQANLIKEYLMSRRRKSKTQE